MNRDVRTLREHALYAAALHLIEQGCDPKTMKVQQIAEAAGIGKGTVYEYFSSKSEILYGMTRYIFDDELHRLQTRLQGCTTRAELSAAVRDYLTDLAKTRMGVYHIIAGSAAGVRLCDGPCQKERTEALRTLVRGTLQRLQDAGQIDAALDMDYCVYALISAAAGGFLALAADPAADPETAGRCMEHLLDRALR